jgi:hypothetical protein
VEVLSRHFWFLYHGVPSLIIGRVCNLSEVENSLWIPMGFWGIEELKICRKWAHNGRVCQLKTPAAIYIPEIFWIREANPRQKWNKKN